MTNSQAIKTEVQIKKGIISVSSPLHIPEVKGLGTTLFEKMSGNKDAVAQIDGLTGEKDTCGQLLQKSIRTAIAMRSKGVTPEHVISTCSFNYRDTCIPVIASLFLGAKVANLDPTISLDDTVHLLKQVCPKIVFVGPEAITLIEDALLGAKIEADIVVFGESENHLQFSELLKQSEQETGFVPAEVGSVHETAIICFSSGTTGLPKGICLSHYGLLAPKLGDKKSTQEQFGKIILTSSSFYWISALATLLYSALGGMVRLVYPKFDKHKIWDLITDYKVNFMFLHPNQAIAVCKNGKPENADTSSLQLLRLGGGPISKEQMMEVRRVFKGTLVGNFYATTESGTGLAWDIPNDLPTLLKKTNSVGRPIKGFEYKVVDPETEEILGPNQKGELRIKTEFGMNGYYNLDSSDAWDSEGFMKTGDIAYYDEEYCFYIVDRIKEMLKFQSWHVVPAKLEGVLLSHPAVEAAVVFGLPHPEDGDHPMGVVVLRRSAADDVTGQELVSFVEERVDDRQKLRGGVKIIKHLPVSPSGKYNRRRIRDMVVRNEI